MKTLIGSLIAGLTAVIASAAPGEPGKGKVLVIFSSETKLTVVTDKVTGKTGGHPTGFFLSELMVPLRKLIGAGYTPVFASPRGTFPVLDKVSDSAFWFQGDEKTYRRVRGECETLGLCGAGLEGTLETKSLVDIRGEGLSGFKGLLVPGGHAPMEDLWKDVDLRAILRHFHAAAKPTALICHGPIALLAALNEPETYVRALRHGDEKAREAVSAGWIYRGYRMTAFSTKEEQQEEPGQDNVLGGFVAFYPDEALDLAGARVLVRGAKWRSNVVVDRELITGQNPFSDEALADAFLHALTER